MKNVFTTTLILACGAAFAGTPANGEFSPAASLDIPSVLARADVRAQAVQAQRAGTIAAGEGAVTREAKPASTLSRAAVKADYLQAQKAGTLPLGGERS